MIFLVRHAQTVGGKGKCIGRTDVPLSDIGKMQAKKLAEEMLAAGVVRLCSSPSQRALDTVKPLSDHLDMLIEVYPQLNEINMGSWDGMEFEEIIRMDPEGFEARGANFGGFKSPGGESFNEVADRAMEALNMIIKGPHPALVMTHAGVIRSVMSRMQHSSMNDLFAFRPIHAHLTIIDLVQGGMRVLGINVPPNEVGRYL